MLSCQHFYCKRNRVQLMSSLLSIALCIIGVAANAQQTITGTITGADGLPLPGASVTVKDQANGTTTDATGKYSLRVQKGETVIFSNIGYITQQVTVSDKSTINIALIS